MIYVKALWMKATLMIAVACVITSSVVCADTVTSGFAIDLTPESAQTLLGSIENFKTPSGQYLTVLPDQVITTPYTVKLSGIHLNLGYSFATPTAAQSAGVWAIQSQTISAEIIVDSINASQTIVQNVNGTELTVYVNATCSNVHLALAPNSTSMNGLVAIALNNGAISYSLQKLDARWSPSAWQITSLNCQGPTGFTDIVKENVATELTSINPFLPAIQTQIQNQLNNIAAITPLRWELNPSDASGVSLKLEPESMQILSNGGASLYGIASFNFAKLKQTACQNMITDLPSAPTVDDSLVVPVKTIQQLMNCAYLNGSLNSGFTSQQFTAFQSLLRSWFLKLFVWPNLEHYNSSSVFQFSLSSTLPPTLGQLSSSKSGVISFNLNAPIKLSLNAPIGSNYVHYLDFTSSLNGPANLSIQNGQVSFKQNSNNLSIVKHWDQDYLTAFGADQFIWTSIIAGYLKKYLANTGLSYALPSWTNAGSFNLSVNNLSLEGDSAVISLKIKALTLP